MPVSTKVSLEIAVLSPFDKATVQIFEHDVASGEHARSCSINVALKREELAGLVLTDIENLCVSRARDFLRLILDHQDSGDTHREITG